MCELSVVTGSFNEIGNVDEWMSRTKAALAASGVSDYEIVWIDNASTDGTAQAVKAHCSDPRVKLIVNARNFGPIRSPFHAIMQAKGAAVVYLASDLQDPPELLPEFVAQWKSGCEVVAGVYKTSKDGFVMAQCRKLYYTIMRAVSEAPQIRNFTGFGLFSRKVVELLRQTGGPMPFVRGLIAEFGLRCGSVSYDKPQRKYGATKNDLLLLIDQALLSLTTMSRAPIRFATIIGLCSSALSFALAFGYLVAKLLYWDSFQLGQAPLLIGLFMFFSVQLLMAGLIGEYISAIHLRLQNKPLVIEAERHNF